MLIKNLSAAKQPSMVLTVLFIAYQNLADFSSGAYDSHVTKALVAAHVSGIAYRTPQVCILYVAWKHRLNVQRTHACSGFVMSSIVCFFLAGASFDRQWVDTITQLERHCFEFGWCRCYRCYIYWSITYRCERIAPRHS